MKKTHLMMPVENQETLSGITVGEMVSNQRQNLSERLQSPNREVSLSSPETL